MWLLPAAFLVVGAKPASQAGTPCASIARLGKPANGLASIAALCQTSDAGSSAIALSGNLTLNACESFDATALAGGLMKSKDPYGVC
jgi:hypothetical protein